MYTSAYFIAQASHTICPDKQNNCILQIIAAIVSSIANGKFLLWLNESVLAYGPKFPIWAKFYHISLILLLYDVIGVVIGCNPSSS